MRKLWWLSISISFKTLVGTIYTPEDVPELINAITNAIDGDIIELSNQTFVLTLANYANDTTEGINGLPSIDVSLTIRNGLIVRDPNLSNDPSENRHFRLFYVASDGQLILDNVELKNGFAGAENEGSNGGAIFNRGSLTLRNSTLTQNRAIMLGGAIYSTGVIDEVRNTHFKFNNVLGVLEQSILSGLGGAIFNAGGIISTIQSTEFFKNSSGSEGYRGGGGAIANTQNGHIFEIIDSTFIENTALGIRGRAGAIFNFCNAEIDNVIRTTFDGNEAAYIGGAIVLNNENELISELCDIARIGKIEHSCFTNNFVVGDSTDINAGFGGAISLASSASLEEIVFTQFSSNSAEKGGGAIFNFGSSNIGRINSSTFSNNEGGIFGGGAIFNLFSSKIGEISNVTFASNKSDSAGGAIFEVNQGVINKLINSTIAQNTSDVGGGIMLIGSVINNLASNIIATNRAKTSPDVGLQEGGAINEASYNLIGIGNGSSLVNGQDNNLVGSKKNVLDPRLAPLGCYGGHTLTMALKPNSIALNNGSNVEALKFDERGQGYFRTVGLKTDMGAYECQTNECFKEKEKCDRGECDTFTYVPVFMPLYPIVPAASTAIFSPPVIPPAEIVPPTKIVPKPVLDNASSKNRAAREILSSQGCSSYETSFGHVIIIILLLARRIFSGR